MDPGVAALVHHRFQEYLDPGGTELLRGLKNVVDKESGDDTGREVTVDRAVGAKNLNLASVRQPQHPEALELQVKA